MKNHNIKSALFISLFSILTSISLFSQQRDLDILVLDKSSGEPIENAFVFLDKTTKGGYTDIRGRILIRQVENQEFTLVFTHLLYEEIRLNSSVLDDSPQIIVEMETKSYDLGEVIVSTKRKNSRKYKSWFKKFEKAFIGDRKVRRKVKIENPEVIWFEETDGVLYAHAVDNIKLRNELTGYEMLIALRKFSINEDEDIVYQGSVFFNDILGDLKNERSITKRRKDYYRHSRQLFFKSLFWKHPVNDEEFRFGETNKQEDETFAFQEREVEQLKWNRGVRADTLVMDGYLTITIKDKLLNAFKYQGLVESKHREAIGTSFLFSNSGKYIVDKQGILINQSDIEESGYWTKFRMAHEFPSSYTGNIYFEEEENIAVLKGLQSYPSQHRPEKVYVHTDRSSYLPLEHLWFKAYLVNAVDHTSNTPSEVVYVDLVDEQGEVVNNWLLHSEEGLEGDMKWTPSFSPGIYLLRAYTNHMRNQGEQFFFEKQIVLSSLETSFESIESENQVVSINVYPEGGDLIDGVNNQVAFVAVDSAGLPVNLKAVIKDEVNNEITRTHTIHSGIGLFNIEPNVEKSYYLETIEGEEVFRVELPPIQTSGISLRINASERENIYIEVLSNEGEIHPDAFLIGHMRGEVFTFVRELSPEKPLTISKASLPPGVIHFTLFDRNERPQAERLVFNDFGYEKSMVRADDLNVEEASHSMTFTIDSSYLDYDMDLSMSIVDEAYYPTALQEQNISSYLHLNSDLTTHIPGLSTYLSDITQTKRFYLDLILRTQAWRRFTWKDLVEDEELEFVAETGYTIEGKVTEKDGDKPLESQVMITTFGPDLQFDQKNTNDDGSFSFGNLMARDTMTYIIQARKGTQEGEDYVIELKGDRLVDISAEPRMGIEFNGKNDVFASELITKDSYEDEDMEDLRTDYLSLQTIDSSIWQIDAPEVTVRGRKKNYTTNRPMRAGWVLLDEADWIAPEANGIGLVSSIAPGRRFHYGADGKMYATIINFYGETEVVPAQVIIDGIGGEPGGSTTTPHQLRTLTADNIESMFVGATFISVTTRQIPRSVEKRLDSGIIYINHPGYYQAREFAKVTSNIPPDLASTVLWDPNVKFDEEGKIVVAIEQAYKKSGYVVVLEGVTTEGDIISFRKEYSNSLK